MTTMELFGGHASFSEVMAAYGHKYFRIEKDKAFKAEMHIDILRLPENRAKGVNLLWASPPCQGFSIAQRGRNWTLDMPPKPKTKTAKMAIRTVKKTLRIIKHSKPRWWFIENPRGVLRKMPFMQGLTRHTIWYCRYGHKNAKPTDIWTNADWFVPRPQCKNGHPDHESAPRGSKTGTQGLKGAAERGRIPAQLFQDILRQIPS